LTGGAGVVGSALARAFDHDGHEVHVLDCFRRGKDSRVPAHINRWRGDIRETGIVWRAIEQADAIFHLAYVQGTQTFYAEPRRVIDVALTGMMNVLHACDAYPGKELFLVSSSEAYQVAPVPTAEDVALTVPDVTNPRYSYGGGKIACEVAAMAYGHAGVFKRLIVARPHNIYGPDAGSDHVIPQFAERIAKLNGSSDFHIQGTGLETRSFCHISDCVEAFRVLLARGEHMNVYHVGNDEEVTIGDLAHRIAAHAHHPIRIVPGEMPKGSPPRRLPDISKLRALGYRPRVSLSEGLPDVLDWYAAHV
jgi:nucleoside-diphosphate-sugar epimerase